MPDYIDKLAKLGKDATEGPWLVNHGIDGYDIWDRARLEAWDRPGDEEGPQGNEIIGTEGSESGGVWEEADAFFIAVSRNVWDELVAVVRAAEAAAGELDGPAGEITVNHDAEADALVTAVAALKAKVESL